MNDEKVVILGTDAQRRDLNCETYFRLKVANSITALCHVYLNQRGFILGFESLPVQFVDRSFCDEYSSFTRLEALIVLAYPRSKQDLLDPVFSFQRDQSRRGVQLIPYVISLPPAIQPVAGTLPLQCVSGGNLSSDTGLLNAFFFNYRAICRLYTLRRSCGQSWLGIARITIQARQRWKAAWNLLTNLAIISGDDGHCTDKP